METPDSTSPRLPVAEVETQRLLLRRWRPSDLQPFAEMNADARVMEFFPSPLTEAESNASAARIQRPFDDHGFGLWAVEIPIERLSRHVLYRAKREMYEHPQGTGPAAEPGTRGRT